MTVRPDKQRKGRSIPKQPVPKITLIDKWDNLLQGRMTYVLWIGLGLSLIFSCLLFDVKVSNAGDDSMYIENAYHFVQDGQLPVYKGTLYSVLLGGIIDVFGINIMPMKLFSLLLILGSLYLFFQAFRTRIASTVLTFTYLIVCVCSYYLYFASQTYSEALYLFLQALLIYLFLHYFIDRKEDVIRWRSDWLKIIGVAFVAFLLFITRNVGLVAILAIVAYLLIERKWKTALSIAAAFVFFMLLFSVLKWMIFGSEGAFGGSQFAEVAYKNLYNKQLGTEDLGGYFHRLMVNSNNFFSKHLYMLMGFREEHVIKVIPLLTTFTYMCLGLSFYVGVKRTNSTVRYLGIHVIALCLATFVALQTNWDQWRQILVYYPYILLLFAFLIHEVLRWGKMVKWQWLMPVVFAIVFFSTINVTAAKIPDSLEALSHNMEGDMLYGMTPDWQNYIRASEWAAKELPQEYTIAVRKPNISFVYTARSFYGIFRLDGSSLEAIKAKYKPNHTAVIMSIPDAANKGIYPGIAPYTIGVIAANFTPSAMTVPQGTLVIYSIPNDSLPIFEARCKARNATYIPDAFEWIAQQKQGRQIFYFDPDQLFNQLKQNKAKYFILASLRLNPNDKNVGIIDTLHKYFMLVEIRYPNSFKLLHMEGKDEPSWVFELNTSAWN